jgi:hypothetical protein
MYAQAKFGAGNGPPQALAEQCRCAASALTPACVSPLELRPLQSRRQISNRKLQLLEGSLNAGPSTTSIFLIANFRGPRRATARWNGNPSGVPVLRKHRDRRTYLRPCGSASRPCPARFCALGSRHPSGAATARQLRYHGAGTPSATSATQGAELDFTLHASGNGPRLERREQISEVARR